MLVAISTANSQSLNPEKIDQLVLAINWVKDALISGSGNGTVFSGDFKGISSFFMDENDTISKMFHNPNHRQDISKNIASVLEVFNAVLKTPVDDKVIEAINKAKEKIADAIISGGGSLLLKEQKGLDYKFEATPNPLIITDYKYGNANGFVTGQIEKGVAQNNNRDTEIQYWENFCLALKNEAKSEKGKSGLKVEEEKFKENVNNLNNSAFNKKIKEGFNKFIEIHNNTLNSLESLPDVNPLHPSPLIPSPHRINYSSSFNGDVPSTEGNNLFDLCPLDEIFTNEEQNIKGAFENFPEGKYQIQFRMDYDQIRILSVEVKSTEVINSKIQTYSLGSFQPHLPKLDVAELNKLKDYIDVSDSRIRCLFNGKTTPKSKEASVLLANLEDIEELHSISDEDYEYLSEFKDFPDGNYQIKGQHNASYPFYTSCVSIEKNEIIQVHEGDVLRKETGQFLDKNYINVSDQKLRNLLRTQASKAAEAARLSEEFGSESEVDRGGRSNPLEPTDAAIDYKEAKTVDIFSGEYQDLPGYDPSFYGMKYDPNNKPGKQFVAAVCKKNKEDIKNETAKHVTVDSIPNEVITVSDSLSISPNILKEDLNKCGVSFSNYSDLDIAKYKSYLDRDDIKTADYNSFRDIDEGFLMSLATQIVTSNHVRFTHEFSKDKEGKGIITPLTDSLDEAPSVVMLNASGIDMTSGFYQANQDKAADDIKGLFQALTKRIQAEELQHVSLVQIGMGVFLDGHNELKDIYANEISKMCKNKPGVTFYMPHGVFTTEQRAKLNEEENFISHGYDAAALAKRLSEKTSGKVGMLNPSDPTVTFGALPFGALSHTGLDSGFVGEEFLAQVTTGSIWNANILNSNAAEATELLEESGLESEDVDKRKRAVEQEASIKTGNVSSIEPRQQVTNRDIFPEKTEEQLSEIIKTNLFFEIQSEKLSKIEEGPTKIENQQEFAKEFYNKYFKQFMDAEDLTKQNAIISEMLNYTGKDEYGISGMSSSDPSSYTRRLDSRDISNIDQKILNAHVAEMRKNGIWGGQEEIMALSYALQIPIDVYNNEGILSNNNAFNSDKTPLKIYYSGGVHYKSGQNGDEDVPGDGNCLFYAILHQLSRVYPSEENFQRLGAQKLRDMACDAIEGKFWDNSDCDKESADLMKALFCR